MCMAFGQGARWLARERVLGASARRPEWSGAVGTQAGGSGQAKRSETRGGVLIALYLDTCERYIRCGARGDRVVHTNAECGCAQPSDTVGLVQSVSECQNRVTARSQPPSQRSRNRHVTAVTPKSPTTLASTYLLLKPTLSPPY